MLLFFLVFYFRFMQSLQWELHVPLLKLSCAVSMNHTLIHVYVDLFSFSFMASKLKLELNVLDMRAFFSNEEGPRGQNVRFQLQF